MSIIPEWLKPTLDQNADAMRAMAEGLHRLAEAQEAANELAQLAISALAANERAS